MNLTVLLAAAITPVQPAPVPQYELVWSDEFEGNRIDPAHWTLVEDCWGGGNDERQCYTAHQRNARVTDGALVITARRERARGNSLPASQRTPANPGQPVTREFTSAKLVTRGKAAWRYGRIEVRARLPQGQGAWPAIWMLPEEDCYGPWAASGEIDILEAVNLGVPCATCPGGRESTILGTLHFGGRWPDNRHKGEEVAYPPVLDGGFHTYAIDWQPGTHRLVCGRAAFRHARRVGMVDDRRGRSAGAVRPSLPSDPQPCDWWQAGRNPRGWRDRRRRLSAPYDGGLGARVANARNGGRPGELAWHGASRQ